MTGCPPCFSKQSSMLYVTGEGVPAGGATLGAGTGSPQTVAGNWRGAWSLDAEGDCARATPLAATNATIKLAKKRIWMLRCPAFGSWLSALGKEALGGRRGTVPVLAMSPRQSASGGPKAWSRQPKAEQTHEFTAI